MTRIKTHWFMLIVGLFVSLLGSASAQTQDAEALQAEFPQPSLEYSPEDVVRIQVGALGSNDDPYPDAGIAITFNFASPQNKLMTGPLERFVLLVKNPLYADMINHVEADYGPVEINGNQARLDVVLTTPDGRRTGFGFILSKQQSGEFEGMWMTDGVARFDVDGGTDTI